MQEIDCPLLPSAGTHKHVAHPHTDMCTMSTRTHIKALISHFSWLSGGLHYLPLSRDTVLCVVYRVRTAAAGTIEW